MLQLNGLGIKMQSRGASIPRLTQSIDPKHQNDVEPKRTTVAKNFDPTHVWTQRMSISG